MCNLDTDPVQCPDTLATSAQGLATRALTEANTGGWVPPAIGGGGASGSGGGNTGTDRSLLGPSPLPPSQGLLDDVTDFTRRAEQPTRVAGAKKRRMEDPSPSASAGPSTASSGPLATSGVPLATSGIVVSPVPAMTDPEVLRRLDKLQEIVGDIPTVLHRLTREIGRLANEVAILQNSSDDGDDGGDDSDDGDDD